MSPRRQVKPAPPAPASGGLTLPRQLGAWTRPDTVRRITDRTIFDYMDGGGELYLAYRFDHLDVVEYSAPDRRLGTLLAEIYWMKGPDDAFGLMSTDWSGEPVSIVPATGSRAAGPARGAEALRRPGGAASAVVPPHDALYGGGLLRFHRGSLYVRLLASRESPAARDQLFALASAIVAGRPPNGPPPALVARVPRRAGRTLTVRPDRTCFFRSYLVLNSMRYLAAEDVLGLGPSVDAVASEFRSARAGDKPVTLVQIVYPTPAAANAALGSFLRGVVPAPARPGGTPPTGTALAADGHVAWSLRDRALALAIGAPGAAVAVELTGAAMASPPAR